MNPNYLTKDEILYELGIRGTTEYMDTQNLRRLFRRVITRDLPLQWVYLTLFRTEVLYSSITTKVHELQEWLTREGLKRTEFALGVDTRVRHFRDRLSHLTQVGLCTPIDELWCNEALQKQLDNIETLAASLLSDATTQHPNSNPQGSEMEPNPPNQRGRNTSSAFAATTKQHVSKVGW
jgi:hypothetical protein